MKKHSAKIALFALIAAGLATPVLMRADDSSTNSMQSAASSDTAPAKPAKHKHGLPFHGKLDEVDTNAMTLTVGSRTFDINSKTKITKDGQPAILSDGVIGQPVSGYYHTNEEGDLEATTIHFGAHKHKAESTDSTTSTNTPSSN